MRACFAVWNGRISPVFDVSRNAVLIETTKECEFKRSHAALPEDCVDKVKMLKALSVDTLICGSISRDLAVLISDIGINIIAFVAGDIEDVIVAYFANNLPNPMLMMPGCKCKRRCNKIKKNHQK